MTTLLDPQPGRSNVLGIGYAQTFASPTRAIAGCSDQSTKLPVQTACVNKSVPRLTLHTGSRVKFCSFVARAIATSLLQQGQDFPTDTCTSSPEQGMLTTGNFAQLRAIWDFRNLTTTITLFTGGVGTLTLECQLPHVDAKGLHRLCSGSSCQSYCRNFWETSC